MKNHSTFHSWLLHVLLVALLVTLVLPAARAQQKRDEPPKPPTISLEPTSGFPSGSIVVTGRGFHQSCGVHLFFDGIDEREPLAFAPVRKDGVFESRLLIPSTAAGQHSVLAQGLRVEYEECTDPSGPSARAELTVLPAPPTLTLSALEGRPGETVTVEGKGFCTYADCSTVRLTIDGQIVADEVEVRGDGTLRVQAMVPAIEAGGEVLVEAVQTLSGGERVRALGELIVTVKPNVRTEGPQ